MVGFPFPAPLYQKIIVAYLWDWDRRVPHLFPLQPLGLQFNIDQNFTVVHIVHYLLSTFSPIKMKKKDNWNYVWENNLFWTFWHSSSHSRRDHTCTLPRLGPQTWGGPKVICSKYSKQWPYTAAHTTDCVCSKMLNHGLNHGLFLSLFKLIHYHIHWIVYVLAYLNFIFEF